MSIPTQQHRAYGSGDRLCGNKTKTSYVDDNVYRTLPKCPTCFSDREVRQVVLENVAQVQPTHTQKSNRIVLRDAMKER